MRIFQVRPDRIGELDALPAALPSQGFLWLSATRAEFEQHLPDVQAALQAWTAGPLVDLHISDLLNTQLPSHYDYTSWYDMLVFRRLVSGVASAAATANGKPGDQPGAAAPAAAVTAVAAQHIGDEARDARTALASVDTSPVGFAVFDHVLITVHPGDCMVRDYFAQRMVGLSGVDARSELRGQARLPVSPADLMLRMVNHMVDSYLDLRRLLTKQFGALQAQLLDPRSRFHDWHILLDARNGLYVLEDTCEDQRGAVQEWIDALDEIPDDDDPHVQRERELLRVRSRDVLEHIERVLGHVRRLEQSAETSVQMHFSALGHRTNDIMRTLTVLTAVFLPLNLITGFFGMNFDKLPLIHSNIGIWVAMAAMVGVAVVLVVLFRRKRYLGSTSR